MTARINAFRAAVVATFATAMPELSECAEQFGRFNLDELETNSIRAPAVRVAVLQADMPQKPAGDREAVLSCAAFVITDGKDRDKAAWTLAEAIAVLLASNQMFGLLKVGVPDAAKIQPVITANIKARGVAIIAVEWSQTVRQLGDVIFDQDGRLLAELYVNGQLTDITEPEWPGDV